MSRRRRFGTLDGATPTVTRVTPGRLTGHTLTELPPKPRADETPYRSLYYVSPTHSADGNAYKPGEPIPEAEAIRQRIADEDGDSDEPDPTWRELQAGMRAMRTIRTRGHVRLADETGWALRAGDCRPCRGTGKCAPAVARRHKQVCACIACRPCRACNGTGHAT